MVYYRKQQIDDAFFALSHPIRRALLDQLTAGEQTVAEVSEKHHLSAAQMTKHLAILERGGLIIRHKVGRSHHLKLQPVMIQEIMQWAKRYEQFWHQRLDALDAFLTNNQEDT